MNILASAEWEELFGYRDTICIPYVLNEEPVGSKNCSFPNHMIIV